MEISADRLFVGGDVVCVKAAATVDPTFVAILRNLLDAILHLSSKDKKAIFAYFTSKQKRHFDFARRRSQLIPLYRYKSMPNSNTSRWIIRRDETL